MSLSGAYGGYGGYGAYGPPEKEDEETQQKQTEPTTKYGGAYGGAYGGYGGYGNNDDNNDDNEDQEDQQSSLSSNPPAQVELRGMNLTNKKLKASKTENIMMNFATNVRRHNSFAEEVMQVDKDWNKEIHIISQLPDSYMKYKNLADLAKDFVYAAKTYGRIIISEQHLPHEKKTIKAVQTGGVAGGDKFLIHSIFFKFAIDKQINDDPPTWMYGGDKPDDAAAMKGAGHDLKGLISCWAATNQTEHRDIHFPTMALIDYRGYRLIAITCLPIKPSETLIYGSADAGETVHKSDTKFNDRMRELGELLNIKAHKVNDAEIYGPGDIEGHKSDGLYYLLDFSRVFPPEAPQGKWSRSVFYKLLRPEFVRSYCTPLSSDAFSRWGFDNKEVHNKEVRDATEHLFNNVIPKFAKNLESEDSMTFESMRLAERLHRNGINIRHCGRVRSHATNSTTKKYLLLEMVARVIKSNISVLLRAKTRQEPLPVQEPYRETILHFLNMLLGFQGHIEDKVFSRQANHFPSHVTQEKTTEYWQKLKQAIDEKFPGGALAEEERPPEYKLKESIELPKLMRKVQDLTGIKLSDRAINALSSPEISPSFFLLDSDLHKLSAKVKHMNMIDEADGYKLYHQAQSLAKELGEEQDPTLIKLWDMANEKFSSAVASSTNNHNAYFQWGLLLYDQATHLPITNITTTTDAHFLNRSSFAHEIKDGLTLLHQAEEKFEMCATLQKQFWKAYYQLGKVLVQRATLLRNVTSAFVLQATLSRAAREFHRAFSLNVGAPAQFRDDFLKDPLPLPQEPVSDATLFRNAAFMQIMLDWCRSGGVSESSSSGEASLCYRAGETLYRYIVAVCQNFNPGDINFYQRLEHLYAQAGSLLDQSLSIRILVDGTTSYRASRVHLTENRLECSVEVGRERSTARQVLFPFQVEALHIPLKMIGHCFVDQPTDHPNFGYAPTNTLSFDEDKDNIANLSQLFVDSLNDCVLPHTKTTFILLSCFSPFVLLRSLVRWSVNGSPKEICIYVCDGPEINPTDLETPTVMFDGPSVKIGNEISRTLATSKSGRYIVIKITPAKNSQKRNPQSDNILRHIAFFGYSESLNAKRTIVTHQASSKSGSGVQGTMVMNLSRTTSHNSSTTLIAPSTPTTSNCSSNHLNAVVKNRPIPPKPVANLFAPTSTLSSTSTPSTSTPQLSSTVPLLPITQEEGHLFEFSMNSQRNYHSSKAGDQNQCLVTLINVAKYSPLLLALTKAHLRERSGSANNTPRTGHSNIGFGSGTGSSLTGVSTLQHINSQKHALGASFGFNSNYSHLNLAKTVGVNDWFLRTIDEFVYLESLSLRDCMESWASEQPITHALQKFSSIQRMDLSSPNCILYAEPILSIIRNYTALQSLNLSNWSSPNSSTNLSQSNSFHKLLCGLVSIPTLVHLDLSHSELAQKVLIGITENKKLRLKELDFSYCSGLIPNHLNQLGKSCNELTSVCFNYCSQLDDVSLRRIVKTNHRTLQRISIKAQAITTNVLIYTFTNVTNLRVFHISDNHNFNDQASEALAKHCILIEDLCITKCNISESALRHVLASLKSLRALDVSRSNLSDAALEDVIRHHNSLRKLYFPNNNISEHIVLNLESLKSLVKIRLSFSTSVLEHVLLVLASKPSSIRTIQIAHPPQSLSKSFLSKISKPGPRSFAWFNPPSQKTEYQTVLRLKNL